MWMGGLRRVSEGAYWERDAYGRESGFGQGPLWGKGGRSANFEFLPHAACS